MLPTYFGARALCLAAALGLGPTALAAATIEVTTLADGAVIEDGQCTLREAIESANADQSVGGCKPGDGLDEIVLSPEGRYAIETDLPPITDGVTLTGLGPDYTIISGARYQAKLFSISTGGARVTLQAMLLEEGNNVARPGRAVTGGGAVESVNSNLTLRYVHIWRGWTTGPGGCLYFAGSTLERRSLIVQDSLFEACLGQGYGGGIAIFGPARASFRRTTIFANDVGAAQYGHGEGGGIYASAQAGLGGDVTLFLNHTTIANNLVRGRFGGGIFVHQNASNADFLMNILNSTIIRNELRSDLSAYPNGAGPRGAGIMLDGSNIRMSLTNTIVSDNVIFSPLGDGLTVAFEPSGLTGPDAPELISLSTNFLDHPVGAVNGSGFLGGNPGPTYDYAGIGSARLGPVQDNGGLTPTAAPDPALGSPVIDIGSCDRERQDQRGFTNAATERRPTPAGPSTPLGSDTCDIGAVEYIPAFALGYRLDFDGDGVPDGEDCAPGHPGRFKGC